MSSMSAKWYPMRLRETGEEECSAGIWCERRVRLHPEFFLVSHIDQNRRLSRLEGQYLVTF